jgi:hypothetical protein
MLPFALFAFDFGIAASISTGLGGQAGDSDTFDFSAGLWPRFSMLIGDNGEFVANAGFSFGIINEDTFFIPELLNTELTMRFGASEIRAGRLFYSDPLSFVAEGLFDGVQFLHFNQSGHFNVGVWYTGLLYKRNAKIIMTSDDLYSYSQPVDYSDFVNTYFAPKRLVAALGWEHPSFNEFLHLNTALVAQFDLSGNYHSQYLIATASVPLSRLRLELGGAVELSRVEEFGLGFAGAFGLYWLIPGHLHSMLSFTGKITGGGSDNIISPFNPVTAKYYGFILKSRLSGLSIFTFDYSARFHQTVGASAGISYFVRSDLGTFAGYPVEPDNEGYFLGPEIYGRVIWSPFSDLQLNFGGGVFIPALGNAGSNEPVRWKLELSISMSLF